MKTSIKTLTTICTVIISLSMTAQPRSHNGNQPQQNNNNNNQSQNDRQVLASNNRHGGGNWGGNVSIHIGGYPTYYGNTNYGYGYNNNYYSIKKAARNSISQSANVIGQALQFSDWNDTYSPWLAKAIQHQQYAKQLYFWGDYSGALNHAERAGFLAWNTLSYFNNGYNNNGYGQNNYPNPYSDPNNPYYRQGNTQPNTNSTNEDYGYRRSSTEQSQDNSGNGRREAQPTVEQKMNKTELDNSLPQNNMSDKELLKINAKDLDIE